MQFKVFDQVEFYFDQVRDFVFNRQYFKFN